MQLILTKEEVARMILSWLETSWPGQFNHVEFGGLYSNEFCSVRKQNETKQTAPS